MFKDFRFNLACSRFTINNTGYFYIEILTKHVV